MMTKCSKIRLQASVLRTNGPLVLLDVQIMIGCQKRAFIFELHCVVHVHGTRRFSTFNITT